MAENNNQTPQAVEPVVEKTSRIKDFTTKHPRVARVAGITAAVTTVVGIAAVVKNRKQDDTLAPAAGSETLVDDSNPQTLEVKEA